jgi:SAM-dependent methyltransferase
MWNARNAGASFDNVLTIGRQNLCLHPDEARFFIRPRAGSAAIVKVPRESCAFGVFAEPFLQACLGAGIVEALDCSDYEGAQHIHDMNEPVPELLADRFDVVFDGGALEHIFNFPIAIANLMRMTKVGGRVFMSTPANNFCGHGFYQFSPELVFRVFAPENGFEVLTVELVEAKYPSPELTRNRVAYAVADPASVQGRVGLITKRPVLMLVEARKLRHVPVFARAPLQSDYARAWSAAKTAALRDTGTRLSLPLILRRRLLAAMPRSLRVRLVGWAQRRSFSFANERVYRRVL